MKTNLQDITEAVCEYFKIDSKMIFTNNRKYPNIRYRQYFIYLAVKNAECTLNYLGEFMKSKGMKYGTNYSNLISHKKLIEELMLKEEKVKEHILKIENIFNNLNTLVPYEVDLLNIAEKNTVFVYFKNIKPELRFFYANNSIDEITDILLNTDFKETKSDKNTKKEYLFIDRLDRIFYKLDWSEIQYFSKKIRKDFNVELRKTRAKNMFR